MRRSAENVEYKYHLKDVTVVLNIVSFDVSSLPVQNQRVGETALTVAICTEGKMAEVSSLLEWLYHLVTPKHFVLFIK